MILKAAIDHLFVKVTAYNERILPPFYHSHTRLVSMRRIDGGSSRDSAQCQLAIAPPLNVQPIQACRALPCGMMRTRFNLPNLNFAYICHCVILSAVTPFF